ncbi:hypothetical protein [Sphingomonas japonica]|uniref:PARP-type domain-containing protein n=1 Tax=Sphingomonas japonica TaxID=511662 RepID=A0ABX0U2Q7_9SPHN|nr:hypothetical protein [Sphingomonas japonica]NIJ24810.1 hypothetical protein [Sphingomonas japonica]
MSFYRERKIVATRKPHRCYGCSHLIAAGNGALYIAASDEENGGIWHGHYHADCRQAEIALNDLLGFCNGDDWTILSNIEGEDRPWLEAEYPAVFARMFRASQPVPA